MRQSRTQALGAGLALLAIGAGVAAIAAGQQRKARRRLRATYDYSDRSGFPRSPSEMRGAGRRPAPARLAT
jgi:hypothetical protein